MGLDTNNMANYQNVDKLRRATKWAKDNGKEGDEEVIENRYLELGGLLTQKSEQEIADREAGTEVEEAPVKRSRKTKDDVEA